MDEFQKGLKPQDRVWWDDPEDISSGPYVVLDIHDAEDPWEGEAIRDEDTLVVIKNKAGSVAEVFLSELFAPRK